MSRRFVALRAKGGESSDGAGWQPWDGIRNFVLGTLGASDDRAERTSCRDARRSADDTGSSAAQTAAVRKDEASAPTNSGSMRTTAADREQVVEIKCVDDSTDDGPTATQELMALQGLWEDLATGFVIQINGDLVDFHDGTGLHRAQPLAEGLVLRGSIFKGAIKQEGEGLLAWQKPDGEEMLWSRAQHAIQDRTWAERFFRFKVARGVLLRHLAKSLGEEDYKTAATIKDTWQSTWGFTKETTPTQQLRLALGRHLVPGACVRHRRHNLRAVILGCEPWIRAPHARRMSQEELSTPPGFGLENYRSQPIYACLADERDFPGSGIVFVPETDLVCDEEAYPLQSKFAESLLDPQDLIRAYLPKGPIREAMQRQQLGMPFMIVDNC